MDKSFDAAEAKAFLAKKEQEQKASFEQERLALLKHSKKVLKDV